jgi:hypothetical protein
METEAPATIGVAAGVGAAEVVGAVSAAGAVDVKHSVCPGWIIVAVVALLAFNSADMVMWAREAILLQESPFTTEYVAPGHAGGFGPTALAIAVTGTMPIANITVAKSQRPRVDALHAIAPLLCSDSGRIRDSLRHLNIGKQVEPLEGPCTR